MLCMTENKTPLLLEEITNRLNHTLVECEKLYNSLSGGVTDIDSGTLIKTRTDAGSATLSLPTNNSEGFMSLYYKRTITDPRLILAE